MTVSSTPKASMNAPIVEIRLYVVSPDASEYS